MKTLFKVLFIALICLCLFINSFAEDKNLINETNAKIINEIMSGIDYNTFNGYFNLKHDDSGRIIEIQFSTAGTETTYTYTYNEGSYSYTAHTVEIPENNKDKITVILNNEIIDFDDVPPTIIEGRTLVPLRRIFESLGADVDWNQSSKTVTSKLKDTVITLTIGENILKRNGENIEIDVPAQIIDGRTMVPVRAISEAFDVKVEWDATFRAVILTQQK